MSVKVIVPLSAPITLGVKVTERVHEELLPTVIGSAPQVAPLSVPLTE